MLHWADYIFNLDLLNHEEKDFVKYYHNMSHDFCKLLLKYALRMHRKSKTVSFVALEASEKTATLLSVSCWMPEPVSIWIPLSLSSRCCSNSLQNFQVNSGERRNDDMVINQLERKKRSTKPTISIGLQRLGPTSHYPCRTIHVPWHKNNENHRVREPIWMWVIAWLKKNITDQVLQWHLNPVLEVSSWTVTCHQAQ